jgi:hypothetical protein
MIVRKSVLACWHVSPKRRDFVRQIFKIMGPCLHCPIFFKDLSHRIYLFREIGILFVQWSGKMKHINIIACAAIAAMTCISYAIGYIGGRRGMFLSVGMLPAEFLPVLISLFCLILLLILLAIALLKRKPAGKPFVLLALGIVFFAADFVIPPTKLFMAGFRQRIKSTIAPGELRDIARVCHAELPIDKPFPGPQKSSLWSETEHRSQWNRLVRSTSLGKLDPWMTISNHSDSVSIVWGGALVGHWGLAIQTDDKVQSGDIAEGIQTFVGPD